MKKLLLFSCMLLLYSLAFPNPGGIIRGFITDSTNGEAVPYSNIVIKQTKLHTRTDSRGYFILTGVPANTNYIISTSLLGYKAKNIAVSVKEDEIVQLNIKLQPSDFKLNDLIVTAEKFDKPNATNLSVEKISFKEIQLRPKGLESDVIRALQTSPGVNTTSDISAKYYVRGGSSDQNLVYLNEATLYNPFHALGIYSVIDPEMISTMEFIKGGFTAENGGRLSSVLNLNTKDGNKNKFGASSTVSLLTAKACLEGPIPNGSFIMTGRKSYFGKMLNNFLDEKDTPFNFYDISAKINYSNPEIFNNAKLIFFTFLTNDQIKYNDPTKEDYKFSNNIYGFNWYQIWASPLYSMMTFSLSEYKANVIQNNSEIKPKENELSDFSTKWDFTYTLESMDEIGFGIQQKIFKSKLSLINLRDVKTSIDNMGLNMSAYIKYKLMRFENIGIDVGSRINLISLSKKSPPFFEPRISFTFRPCSDLAIKSSYGIYTQEIVTLTDENELISIFEPWVVTPDNIKPSQATHYVLGIEYNANEFIVLNCDGYYKDYKNVLDVNNDKATATDPDFIAAKAESYGLESSLKFQSSDIYFTLSYSLGWAYKYNNGAKYSPRYDTRHQFNTLTSYNLGKGWDFNTVWTFNSGMPFTAINGYYDQLKLSGNLWQPWIINGPFSPVISLGDKNVHRLPYYHRLDISISKKFELSFMKLTAELNIVNVYNRKNIFYFKKETGERVNMLPFMPTASLKIEI